MDLSAKIKQILDIIKANKTANEVVLLGATKQVDAKTIDLAYELGLRVVGENRVNEFLDKFDNVTAPVKWHFIGRLQTNKVKYVVGKVSLIHSVDSERLLAEIDKQSIKKGVVTNVLIEVNMGGEESKGGVRLSEVLELCEIATKYENVILCGIMCVFPRDAEKKLYVEARELFEKIKKKYETVSILSMGMSEDLVVALANGSTLVRVGSGLFGKRKYEERK